MLNGSRCRRKPGPVPGRGGAAAAAAAFAAMLFLQDPARVTHAFSGLASGRGVGRMGMSESVW